MRFTLFISFCLLFMGSIVHAQHEEKEETMVIHTFFKAMYDADTVTLRNLLTQDALLQTIRTDGAENKVINEDIDTFIASIGKQQKGNLDERISVGTFFSDGILATIVTPYNFYYKGVFSHCGTNAFHLLKGINGWKIHYIIDTRKKEGCFP
jgi:hypothetical protein